MAVRMYVYVNALVCMDLYMYVYFSICDDRTLDI